jgi:antitoxin component YwqK of YwqJK toxin-antitoxin module
MKRKIKIVFCVSILLLSACGRSSSAPEDLVLIQIQDRNGLSETISNPDRLTILSQTDFLSTQPYKKVLRVYRQEGKNRSVITTYHPNGTPWQLLEAKEMRANGSFKEWFPSGAKKIEATVIGGSADLCGGAQESWLFDGQSKVWNEDGQLIAIISYDKGVLSGICSYYYPSSMLEKEIPYVNDHIEGEKREFWPNGQIKSKSLYQNGVQNGTSIAFWLDGNLCWKEEYEQGLLKQGLYWNPAKECVAEVTDSSGFQAVFTDQQLSELREIRQGIPDGSVKTFNMSGSLRSEYTVKGGKKHGDEIEYFPLKDASQPRVPKISIHWDQDSIHGLVKTWYDNGQLQSQREMCRNQQNGASCNWYRDGSLMSTEEYENGQLIRGQYYRKNQRDPISCITNGSGVATLYDEEGVFLKKVCYSKGKIVDPE